MSTKAKHFIAAAALVAATAAFAQQEQFPTYGPLKQPVPVPGAKPLNVPTIDALKGDGPPLSRHRHGDDEGGREPATGRSLPLERDRHREGQFAQWPDRRRALRAERRTPPGWPADLAIPAPDGSAYLVYSAGENPSASPSRCRPTTSASCPSSPSSAPRTTTRARKPRKRAAPASRPTRSPTSSSRASWTTSSCCRPRSRSRARPTRHSSS